MTILRGFAVLFGLLAVSNLIKSLGFVEGWAFVFMGRRLTGLPNLIAGMSFGVFLGSYALSLWRARSHALPLGIAYAAYVSANVYLFQLRLPSMEGEVKLFGPLYILLATGTAWGSVVAMLRGGLDLSDVPGGRTLLRAFALLFSWMALSNFLKPFAYGATVGFVLLGERLTGTANVIAAVAFSAYLATYAHAIWNERSHALPMGVAYAVYVVLNLALWNVRKPEGSDAPLLFVIPYLISAVGVSSGAAYILYSHRERLN